jgi:hypothetical protein
MAHGFSPVKVSLCALFAAIVVSITAPSASAQSTAFTFQGQLKSGGTPIAGLFDVSFKLFDAASAGTQIGTTQCFANSIVADGVLSTVIDFGPQFTTTAQRFIEVSVRPATGLACANTTGFTTLAPRQLVSGAPTAIHAKSAFALDSADGSHANAVFVNAAGKVGVNNTTPFAQLDVHGDASFGDTGMFKVAHDGRVTMGNVGNLSQLTIEGQDAIEISGFQPFITMRDENIGFSTRIQSVNAGISFQGGNFISGIADSFMFMDASGRLGIHKIPTVDLDVTGNIRCTSLTQTSSAAFKDKVTPLAPGLNELLQLRPVSYVWNDKAPRDSRGKHDLGFIAEEVEKVLPDAVAKDPSGAAVGIDYSRITVLAVNAIKEQQARHEADREEIRSLRERLEKLEAAIAKKP